MKKALALLAFGGLLAAAVLQPGSASRNQVGRSAAPALVKQSVHRNVKLACPICPDHECPLDGSRKKDCPPCEDCP